MMRIGAVLLAAGRSLRFGSNKLLADLGGRPMVCRAMDAMAQLEAARFAAVVSSAEVAALAEAYGFEVIKNDAPEMGQARSVVLGMQAMGDMDAVLFLAGDQPGLGGESLRLLIRRFEESGKGIACLADKTHRGNPAVFRKQYFPELLSLSGDRGAKGVLRAHEDDLLVVPCVNPGELADADTPEALDAIRAEMR